MCHSISNLDDWIDKQLSAQQQNDGLRQVKAKDKNDEWVVVFCLCLCEDLIHIKDQ